MKFNIKFALAGIVTTTSIGLANMDDPAELNPVERKINHIMVDNRFTLNKDTTYTNVSEFGYKVKRSPVGGN